MARLDLEAVATRTRDQEHPEEDRAATNMSTSGDLRPATEPAAGMSFDDPLSVLRDLSFWYGHTNTMGFSTISWEGTRKL